MFNTSYAERRIARSKHLLLVPWHWHDDVIKWKHSPRNWPFVRRIHRSPVNSPHKGQWRGALMFPLICVWINDWVNNSEADDLRRYQANYDVIVMKTQDKGSLSSTGKDFNYVCHFSTVTMKIFRASPKAILHVTGRMNAHTAYDTYSSSSCI